MGSTKKTTKSPTKKRTGGSRAGAGRKAEALPAELITSIGAPPKKLGELRVWCAHALAAISWAQFSGTCTARVAQHARTSITAIARVLDRPARSRDLDDNDDWDEDEVEEGGRIELVEGSFDNTESLRVG